MMNQNWPRWFFASLSKHFTDNVSLTMFIEGRIRDTKNLQDFCEFRMDGPWFKEVNKGYWAVDVEVNILVTSAMQIDFHKIHRDAGIVTAAFHNRIKIFKYGTAVVDDGSLLTCMQLMPQVQGHDVQVNHFGQIDPNKALLQATIEGHYKATLTS